MANRIHQEPPFMAQDEPMAPVRMDTAKKILQFDVVDSFDDGNEDDNAPSKSMTAEELLKHLDSMIHWDRRTHADFAERYQEEQRRIQECQDWDTHYEEEDNVYYENDPSQSQSQQEPENSMFTSFHSGNSIVAPFKEIWT
mmetsp:Transcript_19628/g.25740  ORF Transcript_19628/g.25740 Transcript_19628/m.25740 type:complete len:141 (-) Transcript_19628:382-804(-)